MKRVLAVFLCAVICFSALPRALAAEGRDFSEETKLAEQLQAVGLFMGADSGFELDRAMSRTEAVVMLVRALGKGDETRTHAKTHPFTDVPAWADGYVSYAWEQGLTQGTSDTTFGAGDPATAEMYLTFMLRALGYTEGSEGDLPWDSPWVLASFMGILPPSVERRDFLRADAVTVSVAALYARCKGTETALYEMLEAEGAFTAERFTQAFPEDPLADYRALDAKVTQAIEARRGEEPYAIMEPNTFSQAFHVLLAARPRDGVLAVETLVYIGDVNLQEGNAVGTHGRSGGLWRIDMDPETWAVREIHTPYDPPYADIMEELFSPETLADVWGERDLDGGIDILWAREIQNGIDQGRFGYRPLTYEEQLKEVPGPVHQRLETELCTVLLTDGWGGPHGNSIHLALVYKGEPPEGKKSPLELPLPGESLFGTHNVPLTLELNGDGTVLTYSYHFDERLVVTDMGGEEFVAHEAGTYVYTVDLATGETELEILPE